MSLQLAKPLPLDVIGCAHIFEWAHAHGLARLPGVWELRSFTDPDEAKLRRFGKKYQVEQLYTDAGKMLSDLHDGAVLNCTPTSVHAEIAIAALRSGRDVLSEKPMAMNCREADAMLVAARESGRILQLCFMSRFAPCWQKIKELLDGGAIGKVMSATMTQYWNGRGLLNDWRTNQEISGGGIIADSAAHWIDILRWLLGEISTLTAAGIPAPDSPKPELDDTSFVLFKFSSGALGVLRNSWRHQRPRNEAETIEIYGTEGSILGNLQTPWIDGGVQTVRLVRGDTVEETTFHDPMQRFANQLEEFGRLVATHDSAAASGQDGRRALELQEAIYRAMREQTWLEVQA